MGYQLGTNGFSEINHKGMQRHLTAAPWSFLLTLTALCASQNQQCCNKCPLGGWRGLRRFAGEAATCDPTSLLQWVRMHGGTVHPNITLVNVPGSSGERHVVCNGTIASGAVILQVPETASIQPSTFPDVSSALGDMTPGLKLSTDVHGGTDTRQVFALAATILLDQAWGNDGRFHGYTRCLPLDCATPLCYTAEEVALLQDKHGARQILRDQDVLAKALATIDWAHLGISTPSAWTWSWAVSTVISRCFTGPDGRLYLLPGLDMLDFSPSGGALRIETIRTGLFRHRLTPAWAKEAIAPLRRGEEVTWTYKAAVATTTPGRAGAASRPTAPAGLFQMLLLYGFTPRSGKISFRVQWDDTTLEAAGLLASPLAALALLGVPAEKTISGAMRLSVVLRTHGRSVPGRTMGAFRVLALLAMGAHEALASAVASGADLGSPECDPKFGVDVYAAQLLRAMVLQELGDGLDTYESDRAQVKRLRCKGRSRSLHILQYRLLRKRAVASSVQWASACAARAG